MSFGEQKDFSSQQKQSQILVMLILPMKSLYFLYETQFTTIILEIMSRVHITFLFSSSLSLLQCDSLVLCAWPYVLTPLATCANVLIDRNNCGRVSHKCNASYTSCSEGVCSMAPAIQLNEPTIIWQGALNGSTFFGLFHVTLPLNITLYNTTTNNVSMRTSGVSLLH